MEQAPFARALRLGLAALVLSAAAGAVPAAAQTLDAATMDRAIAAAKHEMLWAELQAPAADFALIKETNDKASADVLETTFYEFGGPKDEAGLPLPTIILNLHVLVKAPPANEHAYWIAVYAQKKTDWIALEDWRLVGDADVLQTVWALEAEGSRWLKKSCLENAPAAKNCGDISQAVAFKRAPKAPYPDPGPENTKE